jgi:hypothetical protein
MVVFEQRELAKAQAHAEELSARVIQQSADLNRAVQALTGLSSLYDLTLLLQHWFHTFSLMNFDQVVADYDLLTALLTQETLDTLFS